jgi:hypothetical protein
MEDIMLEMDRIIRPLVKKILIEVFFSCSSFYGIGVNFRDLYLCGP